MDADGEVAEGMGPARPDAIEVQLDAASDAPVDPETARVLEASFAAVGGSLISVRERVLGEIERAARSRRPPAPPIPLFGRRRVTLGLIYGTAAALLLTAYGGYLTLIRAQRQALTIEARCDVRNLAIVLRTLKERAAPETPAPGLDGALARLGLERDPFGNPFAYEGAGGRVWSYGLNGRNDGGAGDDIVAFVR